MTETDFPGLVSLNGAEPDPVELGEVNPFHEAAPASERARTLDGWTFVQAAAETAPAVWGEGDAILWAQGEPFMLVGPDGVGKTSLGQQLALARLTGGTLLGLPIAPLAGSSSTSQPTGRRRRPAR